jgi:hypothetical protein
MQLTHSSSQKNAAFQHLFSLPEHETLLNDYVCAIKKKFNVQVIVISLAKPAERCFFCNLELHSFVESWRA